MSTTPTRIYAVTPKAADAGKNSTRLIRAANQGQALRHVLRTSLNITVASQDDLVAALGSGIPVETATDVGTLDPQVTITE